MKKLLSSIFIISSFFAAAQFPQGINYQSIIRNASGVVLPSTPVTVEFKLYTSPTFSLGSVLLYHETHSATTNSFGMVNLTIGQGTVVGGLVAFNSVPWIAGIHYEVWVNSSQMGTRQPFMSVPYAMNALTADWAPSPTLAVTGNTLTVGSNTITIPTGPSYTAGSGIGISGNTITNNAPDQTVSVTGIGSATVTGTYPNFTIETPTVAATTPPSIVGAGSATVTSSGNTFTVNTPVPQVYTAGSGIDITGGIITNTAVAVTPTITGTGMANVTSAGNSFTVDVPAAANPTIIGTGAASVTSAGNSFTVDVPAPATQTIAGTGTGVATVTTSATNFTVNVPAPIYNPATGVLTTGSQSVTVAPTLALSGTTLTSGASTNSVNLAALPGLWSAPTSSTVVTTNTLALVGIGTPTPGYKLDVYADGSVPATIHGYNSGATTSATGVFGEHPGNGIGVYGQSLTGKGVWGSATTSGIGVYGESVSGDAGRFLMTGTGTSFGVQVQTNGTGAALYAKSNYTPNPLAGKFDGHVNIGGKTRIDSSLTMASYNVPPAVSVVNEGRIYFDRTLGKFMVSESTGPYKQLFSNGPWVQSPGQVTLNTITDMVGIGTGAPNAQLEVAVSNSVSDGVQINIQDVNNGGNALQVSHSGIGNAGFFNINNTSNTSSAIIAGTNGSGHVINATQNGTGQAGRFFINNISNNSSAVWARTTGGGPVYTAEQFGTGRGVDFRIFGTSNNQAVVFAQTVGTGVAGYFEVANTSSNNNALVGVTSGTGDAILGNHLGSSGSAGHFNIPGGSPNTSPALLATNIASGNALNAAAGDGYAVYATNSSSVNSTVYASNSGIGDAAQFIAGQGRALYLANNSTSGYSGLEVSNSGTGNVISAYKNTGSTGGNIGSFSNNSSSNAADAVLISNNGAGAALHSISAATSTVGLWVQNGHIKSTQAAQPGVATFSVTGGASAVTYTLTNGTDVKGSLLAVVTTTGMINAGGQVTMRVTFNKGYSVSPTVVITPTSDFGVMSYYISAVAPGSFNVTLKNNTATNIPGSSQSYSFNYFVIE